MLKRSLLVLLATLTAAVAEPLFNGKDLTGWEGTGCTAAGDVEAVQDGTVTTTASYGNFLLGLEYKLAAEASGGVLLRADNKATTGPRGLQVQLLDDHGTLAFVDSDLAPGALRRAAAARRGLSKPAGEWNSLVVLALGNRIKVQLNDHTAVDCDLGTLTAAEGLIRPSGAVGLTAKGKIEFRAVSLVPLAADAAVPLVGDDLHRAQPGDNTPPPGFVALFNGKDLDGWKGLVADPPHRAAMNADQLAAAQKTAAQRMRDHWKAVDGVICFDGKGDSLCTLKDYGDFELYVTWKILFNGDSGLYLRGSPQVQIWDPSHWHIGSGGLYNNQKNPSKPSEIADYPIDTWNTFRVKMIGEKVSIWLNGKLVTDKVPLENYWERDKPIYPRGQIELQNHGNFLWFKNVYLREITQPDQEK